MLTGKEAAGLEGSLVVECWLSTHKLWVKPPGGEKGRGGGGWVGTEGQGLGRNQTLKTVFYFSSLKLALNV